jgi:hypothetical protein
VPLVSLANEWLGRVRDPFVRSELAAVRTVDFFPDRSGCRLPGHVRHANRLAHEQHASEPPSAERPICLFARAGRAADPVYAAPGSCFGPNTSSCTSSEIDGDPADVVDHRWRPIAEDQLHRNRQGEPLTHRLMRLDHVSRESARLRGRCRAFSSTDSVIRR